MSDLVTLSPEAVERDAFSRWMTDELLHKFHNLIGHRFKVGVPQPYVADNLLDTDNNTEAL